MPSKLRARSKSPARSPSRGRGRPRSKSRGRSPSRNSPSRKSPSRKSPSRTKAKQSPSPSPTRKPKESTLLPAETPTRQSARLAEKAVQEEHAAGDNVKTSSSRSTKETKNEKSTFQYDFGGPIGTFFMLIAMPIVVWAVNKSCTKGSCKFDKLPAFSALPKEIRSLFDYQAVGIFFGWVAFQLILSMLPVGQLIAGQHAKGSKALKYRCNGFLSMVISFAGLGALKYFGYPVKTLVSKFPQLMATAMVFSLVLAVFLYMKSRYVPASQLSRRGNSGCPHYDFFIGSELNPRLGALDFKFFCKRLGLLTWVMLDLMFVWNAYNNNNFTAALGVVAAFQTLYVADALLFEDAFLTTMDINTEGFGFMSAFISIAKVPFLYCLQARYLMDHSKSWHAACIAGFVFIKLLGYVIYRGANSEKDKFRKDPHNPLFAKFDTIPTQSGKKLLASGWWGLCRHPNYLGDIIMALAWSLPTGFGSVVPYLYPFFLTLTLLYRQRRDEASCRQKYGAAWDRYCQRVQYRIIPYVY